MSLARDALPIAAAVLVPVVTGVAGALGLMFQDRRTRRSGAGRTQEAARRVAFVDQWWKTRQAINPTAEGSQEAEARALAWLEEASALFTTPAEEPAGVTVRRLLLLERFHRRAASILRAGYYLFLCLMLLTTAAASATAADTKHYTIGDVVWSYLYAALFGLIALALRFSAVIAENPPPSATSPSSAD